LNEEREVRKGETAIHETIHQMEDEHMMLIELRAQEENLGKRLATIMGNLQSEVDTVIPIPPESVGKPCRAAFLASDAVVIVFEADGTMVSKPLRVFPPELIVSIIRGCTSELIRLMSEKRRAEGSRLSSIERVLDELRMASTTPAQTRVYEPEKRHTEGNKLRSIERVSDESKTASAAPAQIDVDEPEKRYEGSRLRSIERVSDESKTADASSAQIDADEPDKEGQEPAHEAVEDSVNSSEQDENVEAAPKANEKKSTFTFKATFGGRQPVAPDCA
jgi:hypothetical protein